MTLIIASFLKIDIASKPWVINLIKLIFDLPSYLLFFGIGILCIFLSTFKREAEK